MTGIIAQLEARAKAAVAERAAAEEAERQALFQHEAAKAAAAQSTRRRAELAEAVEQSLAAEDAGRDRLGQCRLARGAADREHERIADVAVLGSDPAARSIAKLRDGAETAGAIVLAHERRVANLAAEREAAEQALADHDAAAALAEQHGRESLLTQLGELVDRNLEAAGTAAVQFVSVLEDARRARIPLAWAVSFASNSPMTQFLRCAHHFGDRLEPGKAVSGGGGRLFWSWSRFAEDFIVNWRTGRGEVDAGSELTPPPLEAA